MSQQPEALRLSEWLSRRTNIMLQDRQAAAELRRLHGLNAELLEACKAMVAWDDAENNAPEYQSDGGAHWRLRQQLCLDAFDKARAAIAKATS